MVTTKNNEYNDRKAAYDAHIEEHIASGFWSRQIEAIKWVDGLIAFFAGKGAAAQADGLSVNEALVLHIFARGVKQVRPRGKAHAIRVFPPVVDTVPDVDGRKVKIFRDVEALPKSDIARLTNLSVHQVTRAVSKLRTRKEFVGLRKIDVYALPNGVSLDCGAPEQLCLFKFDDYTFIKRHAREQRVRVGETWTGQMEAATERQHAIGGPVAKPHLAVVPNNDAIPTTGTGGE